MDEKRILRRDIHSLLGVFQDLMHLPHIRVAAIECAILVRESLYLSQYRRLGSMTPSLSNNHILFLFAIFGFHVTFNEHFECRLGFCNQSKSDLCRMRLERTMDR